MICPHCGIGVSIDFEPSYYQIPSEHSENKGGFCIETGFCPECNGFIAVVQKGNKLYENNNQQWLEETLPKEFMYPKFPSSTILDNSIPEDYQKNFREAEQILPISPKASATLSRYLLQMILHKQLNIKKRNLEEEINAFSDMTNIPSNLVTMLHVLRKVANFGAHPKKSTNSNEIVEVEAGEAEIMLDVIRDTFDFVFVKPKQEEKFLKEVKSKYGIMV